MQTAIASSSNPVLDFDTILFHGYAENVGEAHMCDQYYGWNATMGGGLYKLTGFKTGGMPVVIDFLKNSVVQNGRFKGKTLAGGAFLSPDLSYDGKTIVFAWAAQETNKCYHIFKVSVDGSNLIQLTDGFCPFVPYSPDLRYWNVSQNDFDPCWLPNGRIVFISERRGGYLRCSNSRPCPTYTLFSMKDDGTDIIPISYHETNEWHPSVNNDGMIVYTRWDYVDRDDCIAHNLWTCYPDGRDPRAPHGNYPLPLSTFGPGSWSDGRGARPIGEWNIRAIPNSVKYVATAAPHHGHSFGDIVIIDPTILDDGKMSQVKCISYPGGSQFSDGAGPWGTAWALNENYFLCNYNRTIRLLKADGTYEELYNSTVGRPIDPMPLRARTKPPVLATATWQGERAGLPGHMRATISIMNIYNGDQPLPSGVTIKSLRIMQIIPQLQAVMNNPRIGYPSEALVRLSLGTVPVEDDGSVYCEAPVAKEMYFQLLDDKGMAVHSMRSGTYVHAGEQLTCYGCHEDKWKATPASSIPLAMKRAPSKLIPEPGAEPFGITPISYYRLVKPIFDAKCVNCHTQKSQGPHDMSFGALKSYAFYWCGDGNPYLNGDIVTAVRGGSRTTPGSFGAAFSRMGKALLNANHQAAAAGISSDDFHRVCLWLDGNSNEFAAYTQGSAQQQGKFVWPELDMDSTNPTGVESAYPAVGQTAIAQKMRQIVSPRALNISRNGRILKITSVNDAIARARIFDMQGHAAGIIAGNGGRTIELDMGAIPRSNGVFAVRLYDSKGNRIGSARISLLQ
jgi:hypothetical protein